jgi:hypothetical protein
MIGLIWGLMVANQKAAWRAGAGFAGSEQSINGRMQASP